MRKPLENDIHIENFQICGFFFFYIGIHDTLKIGVTVQTADIHSVKEFNLFF